MRGKKTHRRDGPPAAGKPAPVASGPENAPVAPRARRPSWIAVGAAVLVAVAGVVAVGRGINRPDQRGQAPRQDLGSLGGVAHVSEQACAQCHQQAVRAWTGSHHDWAMKPATEATVRADFNGTSFNQFGVSSRFFRKNGRFYVNTEGPDGAPADFEVKYTFGYTPLQQYLIEFPGGRLQSLTIAWDTKANRWFSLYPDEQIKPGDPLHWTGRYQTWNLMCADCHSTNLRRNYDAGTDSYRTVWSEINVGCQSCHGPGAAHVEWARQQGAPHPGAPRLDAAQMKLTVDLRGGGQRVEVDTCAPCHARRHRVAPYDTPAPVYMDVYATALLRPDLYFPDGQQRDEVYIHGSFLQSRMHQRGVRCSDCHEPHSLKLRQAGNAMCTTCHRPDPPAQFPMPEPKAYDTPAHHFHPAGTPGAECVSCHMAPRTYMVVDPRRDHAFKVPRPDLTIAIGTPNACNQCHADRTPQWAGEAVARWHRPSRRRSPDDGPLFAAAWARRRDAVPALVALAQDSTRPAFIRASALDALRSYEGTAGPARVALTYPDPMVRTAAVASLESLAPAARRLEVLAPLLRDPVRAVRIETARALAAVPAAEWPPEQRQAFAAALAEFRAAQMATADMPSSHFQLGVVAAALGQGEEAEREYRKAIEMDPWFLPARMNLAVLLNRTGRNVDAERALGEAIQRFPAAAEPQYSLGLLLAEENRLPEAVHFLKQAVEREPGRTRIRYNLALALARLERPAEAEAELLKAHEADRGDPDYLHALAAFYVRQRRLPEALAYAEQLAALLPNTPGPVELVQQIRNAMGIKGAEPPPAPARQRR